MTIRRQPGYFIDVAEGHYVGFARCYCRRRHFRLYQIIWPNNDGLYPWSPKATRTIPRMATLAWPCPACFVSGKRQRVSVIP